MFSSWLVLGLDGVKTAGVHPRWICECACGRKVSVVQPSLVNGKSTKCTACSVSNLKMARRTHGHKSGGRTTRAYLCWQGILKRTGNPKEKAYKDYGGRGITVCERWASSFENFLADMGEPPQGKSIERMNNDGNYEPSNCTWATSTEQRRNQRPPTKDRKPYPKGVKRNRRRMAA